MNNNDSGLLAEQEVITEINNKVYSSINNNLRQVIRCLFGVVNENSLVKCYKVDDENKTDFVIEINKEKRNVSMKQGRAEIVHNEILNNFCNFLLENGISDRTVETIKMFHYGDGTSDGTGEKRYPYIKVVSMYADRIREANYELNASSDFIIRVMKRTVFEGTSKTPIVADCIYFGNIHFGRVATKKQIFKHINRRDFSWIENLHIGPLLLRPHSRYVDRPIYDVRNRNRIILYWPNLSADIDYISSHYNYNFTF